MHSIHLALHESSNSSKRAKRIYIYTYTYTYILYNYISIIYDIKYICNTSLVCGLVIPVFYLPSPCIYIYIYIYHKPRYIYIYIYCNILYITFMTYITYMTRRTFKFSIILQPMKETKRNSICERNFVNTYNTCYEKITFYVL